MSVTSRRLRLGMVGGGLGGTIGKCHRASALMDGQWDLVAGALSRNTSVAEESARLWLISPERSYSSFEIMAKAESAREDKIDAVAICTTNDTHHEIACAFMENGIHVICEKPLTTSEDKAE